jgi:hypothetical protein
MSVGGVVMTGGPGGVMLRCGPGGLVGAVELGGWSAARSSSGGGEGWSCSSTVRIRMLPTATAPALGAAGASASGTTPPDSGLRGLSGGGSVGAARKPGSGVLLGGMTCRTASVMRDWLCSARA